MSQQQQVKVPYSYFTKSAARDYQSPRDAFFREYLQNSVDAGSRNIDFKIYEEAGKIMFECQDDGCGMTADIITDKLLTLGETSKGEGQTGGFGVAKILIYFSHPSYQIYSQDNIVRGEGGNYSLEKGEMVKGTRSVIEINKEVISGELQSLIYGLKYEIRRSFLPKVNITINGDQVSAERKKGRQVADLGEITIHKQNLKGSTEYYALVRVNGLNMFQVYVGDHNFELIVELKTYSVEILTTNRDGFKGDLAHKVRAALEEICQDPTKQKQKSMTSHFKGRTPRFSPDKEAAEKTERKLVTLSERIQEVLVEGERDKEVIFAEVKQLVEEVVAEAGLSDAVQMMEKVDTIKSFVGRQIDKFLAVGTKVCISCIDLSLILAHDVYIQTIGKYRKVPSAWEPANFTDKQRDLLALWAKIVGMVLRDIGYANVRYDAGFVFDDGSQGEVTLAQYHKMESGIEVFYINPCQYGDAKSFPVASKKRTEMVMWLMNVAVHEVTHYVGMRGHNHEFVAKEAALKFKVLQNIQEYLTL